MRSHNSLYVIVILTALLLSSCQSNSNNKITCGKMVSLPSSKTGIAFTNSVNESAKRNSIGFDYFYNGSGVAIGDIDNDGLSDIFFTGNDSPNALYKNLGNMEFENITVTSGIASPNRWATGVNMVDINADGFLDIYVCYAGLASTLAAKKDEFFINDGSGKFVNKIEEMGLDKPTSSMQSSFFDYDNDGDLDLWLNNHGNYNGNISKFYDEVGKLSPEERATITTKLYRNDNNVFTDVTEASGVANYNFGLGLATTDLNDDGLLDVYVANDYFLPDFYYLNQGDGTFKDVINDRIDHSSYYSMGCDVADVNNDEINDIGVVDMTPSDHVRNKQLMASMDSERFRLLTERLEFNRQYMFNSIQLGVGQGYYSEVGKSMKVSQTDWSWAALFADFDNDSFKDFYVANGYLRDTKDNDFKQKVKNNPIPIEGLTEEQFAKHLEMIPSKPIPNKLFKNIKGEYFEDASTNWTTNTPTFSHGAAYGDLDNDGDLDLVVNNLNSPATILENQISDNNYIGIKLTDSRNPNAAINAKVFIHKEGQVLRYDNYFSRGYLSSVDQKLTVGIGQGEKIDSILIRWLDGSLSKVDNPKINTYHTYDKSSMPDVKLTGKNQKFAFLNITGKVANFQIKHSENKFNDFEKEILLPHKYSSLGPSLTIADFNGDSKDDIFMGNSQGSPSIVMIQDGNSFNKAQLTASAEYEDIGSIAFDADQDGDLDLLVTTGGGGDCTTAKALRDRIYLNDGSGNFTEKRDALPNNLSSSNSATVAIDFDLDGDVDLFTFGRNKPGLYPQKESSFLLSNKNGSFSIFDLGDLSTQISGMVTDAEVIDYNGDKYADIMITAEWDNPKVLVGQGSAPYYTIESIPVLNNKQGWWQSITVGDFDNDGDDDYILGNMGVNNKFHPSEEKPLGIMANDFDNSGTLDIVLTKKYKNKTVPVRGKQCSTEQMPFLESKMPTYSLFANSSIEEIYGEEKISEAEKMKATTFESIILWNNSGSYSMEALPFMAQQSPILDGAVLDINEDGYQDIVICGNIIDTEPETPSYDAGKGVIIYGGKDGNLKADYIINKTGLYFGNNSRKIGTLRLSGEQKGIVLSANNSYMQLYIKT